MKKMLVRIENIKEASSGDIIYTCRLKKNHDADDAGFERLHRWIKQAQDKLRKRLTKEERANEKRGLERHKRELSEAIEYKHNALSIGKAMLEMTTEGGR
jgi:hypothetical protein